MSLLVPLPVALWLGLMCLMAGVFFERERLKRKARDGYLDGS